jgi:sugar phosphate isomerase/epimerase
MSNTTNRSRPSKLAVQMYTIRDFTKTQADLADAIAKMAEIGYKAVQLSAVGAMGGDAPEVDAALAKQMLDDSGLACIATHRSWDALANNMQFEIDFHHTLACDYVAIGGIPQDYGKDKADGYRRFAQDAKPVIAQLKEAGIRFGFHNHAHEFERHTPGSAHTLLDILIDEGGPNHLLELDLYWAWHGGIDPVQLLAKCHGKVPVIHLKDKEIVEGKPEIGAIGEGNLPWNSIIPACEVAGVDWYGVEQDTCRRDPFDCLRSSFEFLTAMGL